MNEDKVIALFQNTRKVIKADKLCKSVGLQTIVMPVPTSISSECGMCLQLKQVDIESFEKLMQENNIESKLYAK